MGVLERNGYESRQVCVLKNVVKLITFVKVLSEWHCCALCSIKSQMLFCGVSHWLLRDIFQAANSLYEAILVFFRGNQCLFSKQEKKRKKSSLISAIVASNDKDFSLSDKAAPGWILRHCTQDQVIAFKA